MFTNRLAGRLSEGCCLNIPSLDRAIELMRDAQRLLDHDHPLIAAHLETVIGMAVEQLCENDNDACANG